MNKTKAGILRLHDWLMRGSLNKKLIQYHYLVNMVDPVGILNDAKSVSSSLSCFICLNMGT
jgi:hypothetical protein